MYSYLIIKRLAYKKLELISEDLENLFVGLVRDKAATEKKVSVELVDGSNVHILHADLTNYASLKQAAADTAEIVGDHGVDYLVANGTFVPTFDAYAPIGALGEKVEELEACASQAFNTNVVSNIHFFNLFLPLVLKGNVKKVITIATGVADLDFTNKCEVDVGALYPVSKAAMNIILAKFSAQYKKDGVLFLGISPGLVEVGRYDNTTPEEMQGLMGFMGKVAQHASYLKGPITPE
ncbi:putative oxidoreductase C663.06c-like protein 2 [Colletotrichum chlorophyti]|uniref:Putative oxidoreductase C663.06c-like protein 2 n=1 Tax=Colletotrichum chlorophyti TaxID=708187 RepID=A0A1Q8S5P0_9PEZI|nr:putative oxidoreductase C663.06c-like protein 2 [Colletotrichum chlorophyti]